MRVGVNPYSLVVSVNVCVYVSRAAARINNFFLPFFETLKLLEFEVISFPTTRRERERERETTERTRKKENGRRLVPGRPLRRPHLRLGHGKWHFPRRRALVFVLSDEVCVWEIFGTICDSFFGTFFLCKARALSLSLFFFFFLFFRRNSLADLFSLPFPFLCRV